jgi:predicted Zn-dependent protease with MMP-like domain
MFEVDRDAFVAMVLEAMDGLPQQFREQIANLDLAVEDAALPDDYARTRTPSGSTLLGVYRGVPLTRRGAHYNMTLPDTIVIFQRPIQRLARDHADLEARVHRVVRHEVAHYFGISDARLHELEAY